MRQPIGLDPERFEDPLSNYDGEEFGSDLEQALVEESVDAIQRKPCLCLSPTVSVKQAIRIMSGEQSASAMVVEEDRVVGIFTLRDVLERVAEQFPKLADRPVGEWMTTNPEVVYATDPSAAAIAAIAVAGHRHVPVLGIDGQLQGVVSPRRVFEFVERFYDEPNASE